MACSLHVFKSMQLMITASHCALTSALALQPHHDAAYKAQEASQADAFRACVFEFCRFCPAGDGQTSNSCVLGMGKELIAHEDNWLHHSSPSGNNSNSWDITFYASCWQLDTLCVAQNSWLTEGPLPPDFLGSSTEWMLGSTPPACNTARSTTGPLPIIMLHQHVKFACPSLPCIAARLSRYGSDAIHGGTEQSGTSGCVHCLFRWHTQGGDQISQLAQMDKRAVISGEQWDED